MTSPMLLLCEEDKSKVSRFFPKEVGKGVRLDLFSIMLMQLQYSLTEYVLEICSILGEPFDFLTD